MSVGMLSTFGQSVHLTKCAAHLANCASLTITLT